MASNLVGYVRYLNSSGRLENPATPPTLTTLDEDGNPLAGGVLTNINTGIYKVEITLTNAEDVVFILDSNDVNFPDYVVVDLERYFNLTATIRSFFATISHTIESYVQRNRIVQIKGNTWDFDIQVFEDYSLMKVQFAVKEKKNHTDANSLLFIDTDTGLVVANSSPAGDASAGAINVFADRLNFTLTAAVSATLTPGSYYYAIQVIDGTTVTEQWTGSFGVSDDIIDAVS